MTYPRTVRYSTLARFIFPVALVSLLGVIFAVVVIDLVFTMSLGLNGRCEPQLVASLRDTPYPGVDNYTRYTVARLGLAPLVGVEPLIPEFGPVINDVLSFKYSISVPPCQDRVITGGRTVFVAVISTAENSDKRKFVTV